MKRPSQNKDFKIRGNWWLPGSSQKVSGDLICADSRMDLVLYGGLDTVIAQSPFHFEHGKGAFPEIHGESLDGLPITLLDAFYTYRKPGIQSFQVVPGTTVPLLSSRLHCNLAALGGHHAANSTFNKCHIEVPSLTTWLADPVFSFNESDSSLGNFRVEYSRPKIKEFSQPSHGSVVRIIHSVQLPSIPTTAPRIRHKSYIEIAAAMPQSIEWFVETTGEVMDLFSLLFGGVLNSKRLILVGEHQDEISVYLPRKRIKQKAYRHFDFVIGSKEALPTFHDVLNNWFSASNATKQARRMLFSSERHPSKFIELRFLPLAHALEVIAKEFAEPIIPKKEFRSVLDTLLDAVPSDQPPELQEAIRSSLKHANSRNLRTSIKKTLESMSLETRSLFCTDPVKFISGIVNTRNYYTHYSRPKHLLEGVALHWTIHKLAMMLRIWLLIRSGISEETVKNCIHRHSTLRPKRDVWRELNEEGLPTRGETHDSDESE